jgi:hypothetical protein
MSTRTLRLLAALMVFGLGGCNTTSYQSLDVIQIPEGVSTQHAKYAIIAAIYSTAPRPMTPEMEFTDRALQAMFPWTYRSQSRRGSWFVEDIRKDSIVAGFDNTKHYLRVEYFIASGVIAPRIDGSRNLRQNSDRIHHAALEWMGQLETRIRANLGIVAREVAKDRTTT